MFGRAWLAVAGALIVVCTAAVGHAADAGVEGRTVAIKVHPSTGKQKLKSLQRGAGVSAGPGSAASELSGSLEIWYVDVPDNRGTLPLPAPWQRHTGTTAKFRNAAAPGGATPVKSALVRTGSSAKVIAAGTGGLDISAPPGPGGVFTMLTVHNAGDGSTHRMCSRYAEASGSTIRHKSGARQQLVLKRGVAADCPGCDDDIRNGSETGVDCGGGSCPACGTGDGCAQPSDCQTGICLDGICRVASCLDGLLNGGETDVDCGGGACPACGAGKACGGASDCQSGVCTMGSCQAPSCGDGIRNGSETDVDCGGGTCPACVPFTVTIDTPAHGAFSLAPSVTVSGHTTGVGPAGADLLINDVPVPLAPDGTFSTSLPLSAAAIFNPVYARLVRHFDGLTAYDRVVPIAGASIPTGARAPDAVAMRVSDRGLDAIEPAATTLIDIDPATLVTPGTLVLADYCYAPLGAICFGSVDVAISGTPPPAIGPVGIALDAQPGHVASTITINTLRVTVNLDSASGIPIHCELHLTVPVTTLTGNFALAPLAPQPSKVDVTQVGAVGVTAMGTTHETDCSGLFGDITESLIGGAIGDVGALFADGMEDFLNTVDGDGNTAIAAAIETALGGIDIAGPVGAGLGIDLDAPFTAITEDALGITLAADIAATALAPPPGTPVLTATYHVDEAFPLFGAATPVQALPYGIGFAISTSGFNQLLRAQIEGGLLRSTLGEIDLGGTPTPITAGLLAALFPPFGTLPPATPIAIRLAPTLAPVLSGLAGPNGELGELRIAHLLVEFVSAADTPEEAVHLALAVDARVGLDLAFQPGGIGFALSEPTADDIVIALLANPLGVSEPALLGFLPGMISSFLPQLAGALESFPLPEFIGFALAGVEVSRFGAYYAIFADLAPACTSGAQCPSGVCLASQCQAPTCMDGVHNGGETDVDCGGGNCPGCATGAGCFLSTDCTVGGCSGGICQPPCDDGSECPSGVCTGGFCRVPNCADGVHNGSETDTDCGGSSPYCVRCAPGSDCASHADCDSGVCSGGVCQTPSCSDGLRNGSETDVDCGGGCPGCALGQQCSVAMDCASNVCGTTARCTCGDQLFTFTVNSNSGGVFDSAEWPGGTATQSASTGCAVTISRPTGNVDLACTLAAPFAVQSFSGFSQCFGAGGEDGDGCQPVSCPPAGVGSCCSGRPSCSAALNGSAQARYFVQCLE